MIALFIGVIVAVVVADLITKFTIDGILNTGISWGLGAELPWLWIVIVVLSLIVAAVVVVMFFRAKRRPVLWTLGLGLFVGGILGNAIDRMVSDGAVHDFIDFALFKNNLADIAITVGAVLFMVSMLTEALHAGR